MGHLTGFGRISVRVSPNFDIGRRGFGEGWFKLCRIVGSCSGLPFGHSFGWGELVWLSFRLPGGFPGGKVSRQDFG